MKIQHGISIGVIEGQTRQNGCYNIEIGEGESRVIIRLQAVNGKLAIDTYLPANSFVSSTATFNY